MLDAITLYFRYWSSCVISLRIVMTDLDLLSCASRKGKTDSDLIRNTLLLWNNVVLCVTFEHKRVWFRFLRQYAVFCVVLKSLDDLFFSCEFALRFINQITVWIDDSFFCVDELSFQFNMSKLKKLVKMNISKLKRLRLKLELQNVAYNDSDCKTFQDAYIWLQESHLFNEFWLLINSES